MNAKSCLLLTLLPVLAFLLLFTGCLWPFELAIDLSVGWGFFLLRVLPQISWNANGILTGIVGVFGFVVGLHVMLRWLSGSFSRPWEWRWTLIAASLVVVMFAAGIATVGSLHQVGWLVTSPGPLRERGSIRVAAASTNSANNLKQMSLAAFVYETAHRSLPPGYTADQWGQPLHGWQTHLLPYLDRDNVYARIQLDRPWDDPANRAAFSTDIREYRSLVSGSETDSSGYCLTHYAGNSHLLTPNKSLSVGRIKDGPSNTILYGEVAAGFRPWGHPLNLRDPSKGIRKSADAFAGPWSSGVTQFAFADGSVRSIRNDISPSVLIALATPAGREEVSGIDW